MGESAAARVVGDRISRLIDAIGKEAQNIADQAARIAKDPEHQVDCGYASQLAQDVLQLALRAERLKALKESAGLYAAEAESLRE